MGGKKMKGKDTILDKEGRVAVMTLNRPEKLNAINDEMRKALSSTFQEVEKDDDLRALIITGAGRGFCSGADVAIQAARASGKEAGTSRKNLLQLGGSLLSGF